MKLESRVMSRPPLPHAAIHLQPWFLLLLGAYSVLELSFNHRLLDLAGHSAQAMSPAVLRDMEVWARVVSGLGLALLLMRWLARWFPSRAMLVLSSTVVGLLVMWHGQKALIEVIMARADQADLAMSVHAYALTGEALKGRIELRGQPVLEAPVSGELKSVFHALWSSSVLGLAPEDLQATSGAAQLAGVMLAPAATQAQMRDAYRRAVMTPVALGASLFFGMLNLCQLFSGSCALILVRLGRDDWLRRVGAWLLPSWVSLCLALTWWQGNAWVDSPGYSQVARPALWQQMPFLAPFVEWSLRAEVAWSDPVEWVHHYLLQDFEFRDAISPLIDRAP